MASDRDYMETNRRHWDECVPIHVASADYDVAGFKAGRNTLGEVERAEVGDVHGKTLLHLQCHFGLDTLSWAREGAIVTGADFSAPGIAQARALASELGIDARFVESNIYDLPNALEGAFDVVFTSIGAITWLPDIRGWARVAASYVKPGGVFYILDGHPISHVIDQDAPPGVLRVNDDYFHEGAWSFDDDGTYADLAAHLTNRHTYEFQHKLGDIVTALIDAGLRIDFLHEHAVTRFNALPWLEALPDGTYRLPAGMTASVPFLFSIRATRPA